MFKMLNFRLTWLFIVALQVFYVSASYGRKRSVPACDPVDPLPLRRINPQMIKGEWKSRYVKLPKNVPLDEVGVDFSVVIGPRFRNGSFPLEFTFRSILTCKCVNILDILADTDTENAFKVVNKDISAEWRFLDLFGDYLLVYHCTKLDDNERCLKSYVSVYSRTLDPIPLADLKKINQSLRKTVCFDFFEDFHKAPATGEGCPALHV